MRIIALCVTILLILPSAARADEEDPFMSVAEAQPFRERWQECTASVVKRQLETARSAETVADSALAACRNRETALAQVLGRRLGRAAARRIVGELRTYDRIVLRRIIERLRGT